jgi:hypothetical protein
MSLYMFSDLYTKELKQVTGPKRLLRNRVTVLLLIPSGARELGHRLTKTVGNTRVDLITLV